MDFVDRSPDAVTAELDVEYLTFEAAVHGDTWHGASVAFRNTHAHVSEFPKLTVQEPLVLWADKDGFYRMRIMYYEAWFDYGSPAYCEGYVLREWALLQRDPMTVR